jgi:hypothetical protein
MIGNVTVTASTNAKEEADRLRERAVRLRAEARALEVELQKSRFASESQKRRSMDDMMHHLFPENSTVATAPHAVARILRDEKWSVDQALVVLEALHHRSNRATTTLRLDSIPSFFEAQKSAAAKQPSSASHNSVRLAVDAADYNLTMACVDSLIEAAAILDAEVIPETRNALSNARWSDGRGATTLKSRWSEWRRSDEKDWERRIAAEVNNARRDNGTASAALNVTSTTNRVPPVLDLSILMESIGILPNWVPSPLRPYVLAARAAVQADDVKIIKDKVLTNSNFFCTSTQTTPSAALFRGNIRGSDPSSPEVDAAATRNQTALVWDDIQRRMEEAGLSERVQLFFLSDPEWRQGKDAREPLPRPVLLALSKRVQPDDAALKQSVLKMVLKRLSFVSAITTVFLYSVRCMALNESFFTSVMTLKEAASLRGCVPIVLGLLGVQAVHELAHWLVAKRNGIKTGFPVPLPFDSIGLFGCITPLRSFPANRTALFDFAMSGPVSALILSIGLMGFGVVRTVRASKAVLATFPFVPASMLKASLLSGSILTVLAPKVMMMPMSQPVPISPWFMVGFAASIASALNLLPVYRLDGGRACAAAMGQRFAAVASTAALLFLLSVSFNPDSYGVGFWWATAVVLFQRRPDIPALNDVTELNEYRFGAWITSLAASILTLAPFPGANGIL